MVAEALLTGEVVIRRPKELAEGAIAMAKSEVSL